mgnify:CR=1 FL=1
MNGSELATQPNDLDRCRFPFDLVQSDDLLLDAAVETLGDLAFVDEGGSNFQVGFAGHDFDVPCLADGLLELLLAFAGHMGAEFWIRRAIMPG